MKIGSLFSGIGGLELGLEWVGVGHTVWQVEMDPYCQAVLAHHWPDAQRYTDVREVGAHNLSPVDVICGGFPCQDISYAGKGAGLAGERSGLWTEFARIVGELGPQYVVVENVHALLTRGIDQVLGTLADLGYDAEWSTLRASDVGAPHRRERVFIVAYRNSEREPQRQGTFSHQRGRVGDSRLAVEHTTGEPEREPDHQANPIAVGGEARIVSGDRGGDVGDTVRERGCGGRVHKNARNAHTPGQVVAWGDAVPVRGADGTVRLIPREAAEGGIESELYPVAHGVPNRVAQLRALGNAVVPQAAEVVGRRLLDIGAER